jgi:tetratricopeptide (TPR) repeat protein
LTTRLGEKLTEALAYQLAGQVAEMRNDTIAADIAFERALGLLAQKNSSQRLIECHVAYAAILEGRGNLEASLEHVRMALQLARPQLQIGVLTGLPASAVALQDQ